MAKYLPLPNGNSLKVPNDMNYDEAMALAHQRFPDLFAEPSTAEGGFTPALKSGLSSLKSDIATLGGRVGAINPETAEKYIKEQEEYRAKTFKPTTEGWSEAPFTKIKELAGQSVPYMAAPVAAGLLRLRVWQRLRLLVLYPLRSLRVPILHVRCKKVRN